MSNTPDSTAEVLAAAQDLRAAFPRVGYVQRNAEKLAAAALHRLQTARRFRIEQTRPEIDDDAHTPEAVG